MHGLGHKVPHPLERPDILQNQQGNLHRCGFYVRSCGSAIVISDFNQVQYIIPFKNIEDLRLVFGKGGHLSGQRDRATMNGSRMRSTNLLNATEDLQAHGTTVAIVRGDAILTRTDIWHGRKQTGNTDLPFFIFHQQAQAKS